METKNKEILKLVNNLGMKAQKAFQKMLDVTTKQKNKTLIDIAEKISLNRKTIFEANKKDIITAKSLGHDAAFINRLTLNEKSIQSMIDGILKIVSLTDPVGEINNIQEQPSGISVGTMRVPLGVILIIYESRPNVTIDAAALSLKSGNAVILRGGSESINSNLELLKICSQTLKNNDMPINSVQLVPTTDRNVVSNLITSEKYIDVIIPRGGKSLIEKISKDAKVPVIKHLDGICHVYIDCYANVDKAVKLTINSKTQRLATCNTLETLLVSEKIANRFLPIICDRLLKKEVELRVCNKSKNILKNKNIKNKNHIKLATTSDWKTEYLRAILSIKIVVDIYDAIDHITKFGSQHTDSIVTENHQNAMLFLKKVDSSSVMVNASTRFADGFEYGLGAEIGISTNKLHARGPVGLKGLTTKKWIVLGNGHIRN